MREGRGKRSSFREPFRLSCFFLKCCNKIIMTGKKSMPTSNTVNWALSLYSGTLIVTFICLILMSLNVSLMWCILTLPWRSISAVHLVPRLTGNHGLGMRFANNFFVPLQCFYPRQKINPGGTKTQQVKIKFRLNFLTLVDFLFPFSPNPHYL